jgi:triacylglycerol lipase
MAALVLLLSLSLALGAAAERAEAAPLPSPGISPPGANDPDCKPTKGHTRPVVLVHGTFGDMSVSWNRLSPELVRRGYCVFALDYGNRGTGRIQESAGELGKFVDKVLKTTGARKVAIVGHSQGGMMPRWYMRFGGGDRKVAELIGLVPSNHGTTNTAAPLVPGCTACKQQVAGSPFMRKLNRGDETPGERISYTQITTRYDEVVIPFSSAFLEGPKTTDVVLQDRCPANSAEHIGIIYDRVAIQWVRNALHRQGRPANPGFKPNCSGV